ncbi:hemolysin family protein [Chengkuizengella axinellae]|uniref:Hemolysin family protein n=1 Tax=Chengkuizengella axinellae TaxID=3064388 RepID=A0ABT9IVA0_9BACL|nr:hemolysin family protein [Chengkuizengella sp. 2205SS18-9]MDP5272987.1 hemolysin family protein [Chengkuizengella sp. 2205SS18-9]
MDYLNLLIVALLIFFTAFFVAVEFAIVKVRSTRIDALVTEGNNNAKAVRKVIDNLDGYLSGAQLGITITSLGLGWIGEPTVEHLLHPIFQYFQLSETVTSTLSFVIAFSIITFLHVVLGELAPKTIAIQKAERVSLMLARPLILFNAIMYPFIWLLNGSARILIKMFGIKPASEHEMAHTEEELRLIISESYKSGEINQSELQYVNNIFEFDDRLAKEIMIPRTEISVIYKNNDVKENLEIINREKYTRYPVASEDKDQIIGMVNVKEIFGDYINGKQEPLEHYIRPIIQVIETTPIKDLLTDLQKNRMHMAILVDEYGGTAGLVTVEDILEEIVGEIRDEFDENEQPEINKVSETSTILDGKVLIEDVNELYNLNIENREIDTIGGWILSEADEIEDGIVVTKGSYEFEIVEHDGHQVKKVEVRKSSFKNEDE